MSRHSTVALLVDRTFGPWFWGLLASNTGNWLFNVTAAVVVFRMTGSALVVGFVSVAQFATHAVLSPWAGMLSDRHDRRMLLLAGQTLATTAATGLTLAAVTFGMHELPGGAWTVLGATFGIGVGTAVTTPAQQSIVPALVDDSDLETAVSLTALTFNLGRALGPATAGFLLVTLGEVAAFAINAMSFLALILALLVIRPRPRPAAEGAGMSVFAGLQFARRDGRVVRLLVGVGVLGFAMDPVITLTPSLADLLRGGDGLVAAMVSASGAAAALVALLSGRLQRAAGSLPVGRGGLGLMAVGLAVAATSPTAVVAVTGFAVTGAGFVLGLTSFTAALLRLVPDGLRGRVMALWTIAFLGTRPLAAVLGGAAADLIGVRPAIGMSVVIATAGSVLMGRRWDAGRSTSTLATGERVEGRRCGDR